MKECCETDVPKKRYWHWVVLGGVVLLAGALQVIPERIHDGDLVRTRTDISALLQGLSEYAANNQGAYPSTLQPLVMPDINGHAYVEGYHGKVPRDRWKREYLYEPPTPEHPKPHVWSFGSDGKRGGSGTAADIDSEQIVDSGR